MSLQSACKIQYFKLCVISITLGNIPIKFANVTRERVENMTKIQCFLRYMLELSGAKIVVF